ncbi:MAG: hypothetical protein L0H59_16010, partial [Tomitella sp.]|nr:hypothetical protein [Tomitella sp.]
ISLDPHITLSNGLAIGVVAIVAFLFGYNDGSWGHPIVRRQWIQFGIVTIITVGIFSFFYLCAYRLSLNPSMEWLPSVCCNNRSAL